MERQLPFPWEQNRTIGVRMPSAEERAEKRAKELTALLWHVASYIIVNGFLWGIDFADGNVDFAYLVSLTWGVGLAFHIAAYLIDTAGSGRRYERILADERRKDAE